MVAVILGSSMVFLDGTVMNLALPRIGKELPGTYVSTLEGQTYAVSGYLAVLAALLILGGALADYHGRRKIFTIGLIGFGLMSVLCGLAPTLELLVIARLFQGAAGALLVPGSLAILTALFEGPARARAFGIWASATSATSLLGPVIGGLLVDGVSWRAAFLINVPLAVAVLAVGSALVEDVAEHRPRFDLPGTLLAVVGSALVTYPLIQGQVWGWPRWTWLLVAAGLALLAAFALVQRAAARRGAATLVETSLFARRGFPAALATSTLFFAVMNGLMLVIVLHLQIGLGRDVLSAGLTLLPWSAGSAVASPAAGTVLVPRFGDRVMFAGLAVLAAGLAAAVAAYACTPVGSGALLAALAVSGVGLGLFTVPFFNAALSQVSPQETGSAAGLLNAVQQLGATLGVAVLGAVFLHDLGRSGPAAAVEQTFWVALALTGLAAATAAAMRTSTSRMVGVGR
jgi:EmrB/QacA subfamily drug resistance transporter